MDVGERDGDTTKPSNLSNFQRDIKYVPTE